MEPSSRRIPRPGARPARPPATRRTVRTNTSRRGAAPRRVGVAGGWIQRRRPQKARSRVAGALGGLRGPVSRLAKRGAKPVESSGTAKRGGRVGGVAILAAAAGFAVKHRDKITALLRRDDDGATRAASDTRAAAPSPPAADLAGVAPADSRGTREGDDGSQP